MADRAFPRELALAIGHLIRVSQEAALARAQQPDAICLADSSTPAELEALVAEVIAEGGYTTKKDMGSAIKDVMARAKGAADGKTVSAAVGKALS